MTETTVFAGRSFADVLRRHRCDAGLTQEELAESAGLSVRGLRYLEKGLRRPTRDTLERLFTALALPAQDREVLTRAGRPAPVRASPRPGAPPGPTGPLVGRERESAAVVGLLTDGGARVLSLVGPGGVGKTRLAQEVVGRVEAGFPDGVVWIPLAAIADPALLPAAVAGALDLAADGPGAELDVLAAALAGRRLLLVLDDFERISGAAATVAALVASCPELVVLVTSRVSLRLRSGREFIVDPLPTPAAGASASVQALATNPAVELFLRRAQATCPDLNLTRGNADAVAEICRRLEGLPLALELAAARAGTLPPAAMLARLHDRLAVLSGSAPDAPQRQRSMRAAIAWSHDLLSPSGQALFRRLAVFEGGCTLSAIEAVCPPSRVPSAGLLDDVEELQRASLLRLEDPAEDEPRFRMLDTVREYAEEQLGATGDAGRLRDRHVAHFQALAEQAAARVFGPDMATCLDQVEREHANLASALRRLTAQQDAARATCLAAALWPYWYVRGHATEGRTALAAVLEIPWDGQEVNKSRAQTLLGSGQLAITQGDYVAAGACAAESATLYRLLEDQRGLAEALLVGGFAARVAENHPAATRLLSEALTTARAAGHDFMTAAALHHLGLLAADRGGDGGTAHRLLRESLQTYRTLGLSRFTALLLLALADVALIQGDRGAARSLMSESLELMLQVGERLGVHGVLDAVARLALEEGEAEAAIRLAGAAAHLRRVQGTREWPATERRRTAWLAVARSMLPSAVCAAVWDEGQVMTQDQASALALAMTEKVAVIAHDT